MAESYISELGDSLSHGVANTNGDRVKIIAPKLYNDGNGNHPSIATALSGKAASNHTHGNIANGGTLTDTAAAASGNDYVVIRDADNAKIQTSSIKGTDVADAVSKKHSHSTLTLSTTAQAYDGSHTLALPSTDPYTSARTPASHTHGNIANGGTLTDTAAAAAGNDYVVIRDADNAKIQTSTIKGTDVADAVSKKHSHSTLTLSTTAQAYDGSHTLALPSTDPYTSARTPTSHSHGNIQNGGTLQTNDITIANGDKLVVTDSSDSSKVARASIAFDGSTTTQALTKAGTWATFNNYSLPLAASGTRGGIQIGYSESGTNYAVKLSSEKAYVTVPWTDTKVTQTKDDSGTTAYPLLMAGAADPNGTATTARYDSGVKLTPSTNTISANISGKAATAGTADKAVADNSGNDIETTYAKKSETEEAISNSVDQTYSPTSTKAQSGVAVNEAFKTRETSSSDDSYTYLGMSRSGSTASSTEKLYWKLVSFKPTANYWTLQFEIDVCNGRKGEKSFDTEIYETKRLTIFSGNKATVEKAIELRYISQSNPDLRGYGNNIYYEMDSSGTVTVYIYAAKSSNLSQICRLTSVRNFSNITNITWHEPVADAGTQPTNPVKFKEDYPAIASTSYNKGSESVPVYINRGTPKSCNTSSLKAGKDDDGNVIKNTYQKKLIAGDNVTIDGNTISSDQLFIATYGTTTFQEIKDAYDAGKICVLFKDSLYYYFELINASQIRFMAQARDSLHSVSVSIDDRWSTFSTQLQTRLKFDSAPTAGSTNPVTSEGIKTALEVLQSNIDTVDAKGIVINEINGENVICFE